LASTRLNIRVREAILSDILEHAFLDRIRSQITEETDFTNLVLDDVLKGHEAMLNAEPDGFFPQRDEFKVMIAGQVKMLSLSAGLTRFLPQPWETAKAKTPGRQGGRRIPYYMTTGNVAAVYDAGCKFARKFETLEHARDKLTEEIHRAMAPAVKTLEAASTVDKLIEFWPEVAAFANKYRNAGEKKAVLLAVKRDDLNASLQLPPQ